MRYYTYDEADLDVTEKMYDIIKLFNDTRTYASANHIAIRPGLPDIFNIFITDTRNFILYIPTLREQLRFLPNFIVEIYLGMCFLNFHSCKLLLI